MSTLSTHVLDTARGRPAEGLDLELFGRGGEGWQALAGGRTNADGRVALAPGGLSPGRYRLVFQTGAWYAGRGERCFYPEVSVDFEVADAGHHHVPLLLSPFGYSTYRGS